MSIVQINAEIKEIKYKYTLKSNLKEYNLDDISTGKAFRDSAFRLNVGGNILGLSWWVSPKRTRSYPFARVYNTAHLDKKVTIIPIVKDEGAQGDRDYLQWDTVSLMSLLNVYVIICWYDSAVRSTRYENKITNQEYNYDYIIQKINELKSFQSDALHWNVNQVSDLQDVAGNARKYYYEKVQSELGVRMKGVDSFDKKIAMITKDADSFKESSRSAAQAAQNRESLTTQPKEKVIFNKGKITVKNWIGGKYFWTVDELVIIGNNAFFIEKKAGNGVIPALSDIKDGFLKQVLYSNISFAETKEKKVEVVPVIGLTGIFFKGTLTSDDHIDEINPEDFNLNQRSYSIVRDVFNEAMVNGIHVFFSNSNSLTQAEQVEILQKFV